METHSFKKGSCGACVNNHGPAPCIVHVMGAAQKNQNFRTAFWTGSCLQMTLSWVSRKSCLHVTICHDIRRIQLSYAAGSSMPPRTALKAV